eukprot:COSAG04_NODE_1214_length_7713_cov_7.578934_2_plen_242_part_00
MWASVIAMLFVLFQPVNALPACGLVDRRADHNHADHYVPLFFSSTVITELCAGNIIREDTEDECTANLELLGAHADPAGMLLTTSTGTMASLASADRGGTPVLHSTEFSGDVSHTVIQNNQDVCTAKVEMPQQGADENQTETERKDSQNERRLLAATALDIVFAYPRALLQYFYLFSATLDIVFTSPRALLQYFYLFSGSSIMAILLTILALQVLRQPPWTADIDARRRTAVGTALRLQTV